MRARGAALSSITQIFSTQITSPGSSRVQIGSFVASHSVHFRTSIVLCALHARSLSERCLRETHIGVDRSPHCRTFRKVGSSVEPAKSTLFRLYVTGTYGALSDITIEDSYVKDVQYAAMAVESRQGSDIDSINFNRIEFADTGAAFFVYLAQQSTISPVGDVPKLGSINNVSFTDITGSTSSWANSPHQGSLITGHIFNGTTYAITNLSFTHVAVTFDGGLSTIPASPPEATPNEYPESNMFGDLPAWGYFLRHVTGVTFTSATSLSASTDARQKLVTDEVTGLVGSP